MRNKVAIIKGDWRLSTQITIADFERINVDRVVMIVGLRHPHLIGERWLPQGNKEEVIMILEELVAHDEKHLLANEYANLFMDHGLNDVRAVEGSALWCAWFFDMVKAFHKNPGQMLSEVIPFEAMSRGRFETPKTWKLNGVEYSWDGIIEILNPHPELG